MTAFADPRDGRRALLALLTDGEHLLELRCRLSKKQWTKRWARTAAAADEIAASMTGRADVYVGVAPRLGRDGDDARRYAACRVLWADLDTHRAVENLAAFDPGPTMTVLSGGLDGDVARRYGFWALTEPLAPEEARRHTRRLAQCLGADMAAAEPARILRVPGSRNHKTGRVATVEEFTGELHDLGAITGGLEDPRGGIGPIVSDQAHGYLIPGGQRYPHLTKFAGLLRSAGVNETTLVECGLVFLRHQCEPDPPMDLQEAAAKLRRMHADWPGAYTPREER
jgi:hypothetical protein